jgi:hypothetical protein
MTSSVTARIVGDSLYGKALSDDRIRGLAAG